MSRADRDEEQIMSECYLPVILGNGLRDHILSLKLLIKYECSSIHCGKRKSIFNALNFYCGFLQLDKSSDPRLNSEKLIDLVAEAEDTTPLLIISSEDYRIEPMLNELESRYLILNARDVEEVAFSPYVDRKRGVRNE